MQGPWLNNITAFNVGKTGATLGGHSSSIRPPAVNTDGHRSAGPYSRFSLSGDGSSPPALTLPQNSPQPFSSALEVLNGHERHNAD